MKQLCTIILFLLLATPAFAFSTSFEEENNWESINASFNSYSEKHYYTNEWIFISTSAVRGTSSEAFNTSSFAFRDRGEFTITNNQETTLQEFTIFVADWMQSPGMNRQVQISTNAGNTWTTITSINKNWFTQEQEYQALTHTLQNPVTKNPGEIIIRIEDAQNDNQGRITIGGFTTTSKELQETTRKDFMYQDTTTNWRVFYGTTQARLSLDNTNTTFYTWSNNKTPLRILASTNTIQALETLNKNNLPLALRQHSIDNFTNTFTTTSLFNNMDAKTTTTLNNHTIYALQSNNQPVWITTSKQGYYELLVPRTNQEYTFYLELA